MSNTSFRGYLYPQGLDIIGNEIARLSTHSKTFNTKDILIKLFNCLDLTTLQTTDTLSSVAEMIRKVNELPVKYPTVGQVGAICVYPSMVKAVKNSLKDTNIHIASVSGGFPSSQTFLDVKVLEAKMAIEQGANEIDIVIPVWAFLEEGFEVVYDEVRAQKELAGNNVAVKVILESGVLNDPRAIFEASIIAMEAGADFIKTSTGKMQPAATLEAAYVMTYAIKLFYQKTGKKVGFKPAGGIQNTELALNYLAVLLHHLDESWFNNSLFRIGASSLANQIIKDVLYFDSGQHVAVAYF